MGKLFKGPLTASTDHLKKLGIVYFELPSGNWAWMGLLYAGWALAICSELV